MKILVGILLLVLALMGGCLYNATPANKVVTIDAGESLEFSIDVYPTTSSLTWFLDENQVGYDQLNFLFETTGDDIGLHELVVQEINPDGINYGPQFRSWEILVVE